MVTLVAFAFSERCNDHFAKIRLAPVFTPVALQLFATFALVALFIMSHCHVFPKVIFSR